MNPEKKLFGIHIVAIKKPRTNKNFANQHPSWTIATQVFRGKIIKKMRAWKHDSTKVILIMHEAPRQVDPPPEASGQSIESGNQSTKSFAEYIKAIATRSQKRSKNTYPIFEKVF